LALDFDRLLFFNARDAISDGMVARLRELPAAVRYVVHGAGKYRFTRVIGDTFLDF
jgi:hypothetical protein